MCERCRQFSWAEFMFVLPFPEWSSPQNPNLLMQEATIGARFRTHLAKFMVSVSMGMRLSAILRGDSWHLNGARPDDSEAFFEPQERALQVAVGEHGHCDRGGKSESHRYQLGGKGT
jgi:hypothetical protein